MKRQGSLKRLGSSFVVVPDAPDGDARADQGVMKKAAYQGPSFQPISIMVYNPKNSPLAKLVEGMVNYDLKREAAWSGWATTVRGLLEHCRRPVRVQEAAGAGEDLSRGDERDDRFLGLPNSVVPE